MDIFKLELGRRRLIGRFYEKEFNLSFLRNLHEFISIKDFLCANTTNRIINHDWFFLCSSSRFFLGKEVSSLPPLEDSVNMERLHFVDVDFPEMKAGTSRLSDESLGIDFPCGIKITEDELLKYQIHDKITGTTIFLKNEMDFLRNTVLKGLIE
ncbi:MAG: hypothetical protein CME61_00615 [Halobacteriovoraceae bacterium]|nr:hypothetical protein [Halobacteriovoraceae bacterium]